MEYGLGFATFKAKEDIDLSDISEHISWFIRQTIDPVRVGFGIMVERIYLSDKSHFLAAMWTERRFTFLFPVWLPAELAPLTKALKIHWCGFRWNLIESDSILRE